MTFSGIFFESRGWVASEFLKVSLFMLFEWIFLAKVEVACQWNGKKG